MRGKHSIVRQRVRKQGGDPKYYASCYGKIRYDKKGAKARADGIDTMKFYKCKFGDHYHVGRKPWRK